VGISTNLFVNDIVLLETTPRTAVYCAEAAEKNIPIRNISDFAALWKM
jgi:hypothetical protein